MAAVTAAVFTVVVFTAVVVTVVVTVAVVMAAVAAVVTSAVGPTACNKRCARQPLLAAVVYRRQTVHDCACGLPGLRKLAAVRYVHAQRRRLGLGHGRAHTFISQDVVITRTVARFGNTSYQIAAINSVSVQHQEGVNRTFLSTGLLLIIPVLVIGYFEWASWIQAGIAGGIIIVITVLLSSAFPIRTATLVLTTASGEAQALTSRDIAGVEQVKLSIEDAFTIRG
jgi:hypothetical protein